MMRCVTSLGPATILLFVAVAPLMAQVAGRHPNTAYIAPAPRTLSVAFGTPGNAQGAVGAQTLVGTIGTEDGSAATLLGRVRHASFLDDTTVAVLDETTPTVRLFSVAGRHLETIGRSGEGPGEFRAPQSVAKSPSGELLIADLRRNIQVFRGGPRGFEHHRTLQLPFSPRSICFVGRRLFVNAKTLDDAPVIHELTDAGEVLRSFGEVYRSPNPLINYQVGQGRIVCDARRQLIYLMPGALLGEVRAFRLTGELVWRVRVSDYRNNIVVDEPDGARVERSQLGAHADAGLALVEGKGLLAMWTFLSAAQMNAKEAPTQTQIVLIDPATGSASALGSWPGVVSDIHGALQLEMSEDPYPRVDVRRSRTP